MPDEPTNYRELAGRMIELAAGGWPDIINRIARATSGDLFFPAERHARSRAAQALPAEVKAIRRPPRGPTPQDRYELDEMLRAGEPKPPAPAPDWDRIIRDPQPFPR